MKHKILLFTIFLFSLFSLTSSGQIPTPNNDVFVTNEVSINTDKLEFSPTFLDNGILFISTNSAGKKFKVKDRRLGKNIMSIFKSTRDSEGALQKPEPFALELLTTVHEGPLTFNTTADQIYFTRNNYKGKRAIKAKDGIVKLQIYTAQRMDNVWKNVEKLPFNDRHSNAAHPSIAVDNDMLFFASDRPGGEGGMDLYVCKKIGDSWGEPINLGPKINTEKDDVFPFIHADGTLYFSSDGHSSKGGLDIFTTKQVNGEWEIPTNMGAPFNSTKDDFGIIIDRDKRNGYFSSSRDGGIGQDDIYSFYALNGLEKEEEPEIEKSVVVNVVDENGEIIEEAIVTYMKLDEATLGNAILGLSGSSNEQQDDLVLKLPVDENAKTGLTDFNGQIPLRLNRGNYVVKVEKNGYTPEQLAINAESEISEYNVTLLPYVEPIASNQGNGNGTGTNSGGVPDGMNPGGTGINGSGVDGGGNGTGSTSGSGFTDNGSTSGTGSGSSTGDPFIDNGVVVSTIEEGTVIELPNIYYNFNDSDIRPDAQKDLDGLADFLLNYPNTEIELLSHTDSRGSDRYNNRLSQRRAEKAVEYLVAKGISSNRVIPKGYGESRLRNDCTDNANCSEAQHQYNRRTEVKILKMDAPITVKFINNLPSYISEAPESVKYAGRSRSSASGGTSSSSSSDNSSGDEYDPDGRYKVIAGAFAEIENAEKRLVRVRSLGFNNADIKKMGSGGLFHVVVSSYNSSQAARQAVRKLKDNNVRSFVKR